MRRHVLIWLLLVAARLHAQPTPNGAGLDLLLLVDRSGSMAGGRAVPNVLVRLAFELIARDAESNRVCHRFALVSFASSTRIDVPLTDVCGSAAQLGRLPSLRAGGGTDVLTALVAARRMLDGLPPSRERRRAIVLLTDGILNIPHRDGASYADELTRFAQKDLRNALTTLDVLLLPTRSARDPKLWRVVASDRAEEVTGESDAVLTAAHRAVTRLLGNRAEETTDALVVPPYLSVIAFDILRPSRDVDVALFAPGARQPIAPAAPGITTMGLGDALMTVVVQRPSPGRWTFRKSDPSARVRILSQEFFPRGRLLVPEPAEPRRVHERVGIAYAIVDTDGLPLRELAAHPLSLDLALRRPDGTHTLLPMARAECAVFRSLEELSCDYAGRYWTEVAIRTIDDEGKSVDVFHDRWSGFTVEDALVSEEIQVVRTAMIPAAVPRERGEKMAMSVADRVGLPAEFQNVLLLFALLLTLAPYLAGVKIGGVQVPALAPRRRRVMKIVGPVALLCGVALVVPFAALARPVARLELLAAEATDLGEIDVAVVNRGTAAALLTKIDIEVLADRHRRARPILRSSASYRIALGNLAAGGRKSLVIRHLVPPNTIERFLIAPETTRALDIRLSIHASGGTTLWSDVRLGPAP